MDSLSIIGSLLGQPLFADEMTASRARSSYARICVEIPATKALPSEIYIDIEGTEGFVQTVKAEWIPKVCSSCKNFFHDATSCPLKENASTSARNLSVPPKIPPPGPEKGRDFWTVVKSRKSREKPRMQATLFSGSENSPEIFIQEQSQVEILAPKMDAASIDMGPATINVAVPVAVPNLDFLAPVRDTESGLTVVEPFFTLPSVETAQTMSTRMVTHSCLVTQLTKATTDEEFLCPLRGALDIDRQENLKTVNGLEVVLEEDLSNDEAHSEVSHDREITFDTYKPNAYPTHLLGT